MSLSLPAIEQLFDDSGARLYGGEAISQTEHALQAAWSAERAGGDDALVVACLLHDLGHLLFEQAEDELARGVDDLHQWRVLPFLRGAFPDSVVDAIGLHVEAKRYLCHAEAGYAEALSPASRLSLALQGGPMDAAQAIGFLDKPHAWRAIALRRHDDAAKVVGLATPGLDHFLSKVEALMIGRPAALSESPDEA
jgi:phosphonate degradation associated HDIG domain protein